METPAAERLEAIVATLQQDLPTLFERDISYGIYSQDIYFQDPVNTFRGKFNYRVIYWTLRFHGRLFFTEVHFDLHRVYPLDGSTIRAEWTVRGRLRLPWKAELLFTGYSLYSVAPDGMINRHIDTWERSPGELLRQFLPQKS